MAMCKNREVKNCWSMEERSVTGDCKDDFINKQMWNRKVKLDDVGRLILKRLEVEVVVVCTSRVCKSTYHFVKNLRPAVLLVD